MLFKPVVLFVPILFSETGASAAGVPEPAETSCRAEFTVDYYR